MTRTVETASDLVIRQASSDDVPAVVSLWNEVNEYHAELDPYFTALPNGGDEFETFVSEQIQSEQAVVWVAEEIGAVTGYCLAREAERPPCFPNRAFGQILDMAVMARARRRGAGKALLRATEQWFRDREIGRVELSVALKNELAQRFWSKMGYRSFVETRFRML